MNYNVNDRIGVSIEGTLYSGTITSLDGFEAQILLDNGSAYTAELDDLLAPEMPQDDGIIDPMLGNLRDQTVNGDRDSYLTQDAKSMSLMTVEKSVLISWKSIAPVHISLPIRYDAVKMLTVEQETFANLSDWHYAYGSVGFDVIAGELDVDGTSPALLLPSWDLNGSTTHSTEFTIKNIPTGKIYVGAQVEETFFYIEIHSGNGAKLWYTDLVEDDQLLETVAFGHSIGVDDVIKVVSDSNRGRQISIYKNDVLIADFVSDAPGNLVTPWGFWSGTDFSVDNFKLQVRAVQVQGYPLPFRFNTIVLPYVPTPVDPNTQQEIINADSNAQPPQPLPKKLLIKFNLAGRVENSLSIRYETAVPRLNNLTLAYRTMTSVTRTIQFQWKMAGTVSKTLSVQYRSRVTISNAMLIIYRNRVTVNKQVAVTWKSLVTVAKAVQVRYGTRTTLSKNVAFRWEQKAPVAKNVAFTWKSLVTVAKSMSIIYDMDPPTDQNVLRNSSFETDTNGNGLGDYWFTWVGGSGDASRTHSITRVPALWNGQYSQRVEITGGVTNTSHTVISPAELVDGNTMYNPVASAGETWTFSIYVRTNAPSKLFARMEFLGAGSNTALLTQDSTMITGDGVTRRVVITATAPANTTRVWVHLRGLTLAGEYFEIDAAKLEPTGAPTDYDNTIIPWPSTPTVTREPILNKVANLTDYYGTAYAPTWQYSDVAISPDGTRVALSWLHNDDHASGLHYGEPKSYAILGDPANPSALFSSAPQLIGERNLPYINDTQRQYNGAHNQPYVAAGPDGKFHTFANMFNADGYAQAQTSTGKAWMYSTIDNAADISFAAYSLTQITNKNSGAVGNGSECSAECDSFGTVHMAGQGHLGSYSGGFSYFRKGSADTGGNIFCKVLGRDYRINGLIYFAGGSLGIQRTKNGNNKHTIHVQWAWNNTNADSHWGMYYAKSEDDGVTWKNAAGTTLTLPLVPNNGADVAAVIPGNYATATNESGASQSWGYGYDSIAAADDGTPILVRAFGSGSSATSHQYRVYVYTGSAWINVAVGPLMRPIGGSAVTYNSDNGKVYVLLLDPGSTSVPGRLKLYSMTLTQLKAGNTTWFEEIVHEFTNTLNYTANLKASLLPNKFWSCIVEPNYNSNARMSPVYCEVPITDDFRKPITTPISNMGAMNGATYQAQNRTSQLAVSRDGSTVAIAFHHNDTSTTPSPSGSTAYNGQPHLYVTYGDPTQPSGFTTPQELATATVNYACSEQEYNARHNQPWIVPKVAGGFKTGGLMMNANGYAECSWPSIYGYFVGESNTNRGTFSAATKAAGELELAVAPVATTNSVDDGTAFTTDNGTHWVVGQSHLRADSGSLQALYLTSTATKWRTKTFLKDYRPTGNIYFGEGAGWMNPDKNTAGFNDIVIAGAFNNQGQPQEVFGLYWMKSSDNGATWKNAAGATITLPVTGTTDTVAAVVPAAMTSGGTYSGSIKGCRGTSGCDADGTALALRPVYITGSTTQVEMRLYVYRNNAWSYVLVGPSSIFWNFDRTFITYNPKDGNVYVLLLIPGAVGGSGQVILYWQPLSNLRNGGSNWNSKVVSTHTNSTSYTSSLRVVEVAHKRLCYLVEPNYANPGRVSPVYGEVSILQGAQGALTLNETPLPAGLTPTTSDGTMYMGAPTFDSLNNVPIGGPDNLKVAQRFRAERTGTITAIANYMIWTSAASSGYHGGTGGTIRCTIETDNGGVPSGVVLDTYDIVQPVTNNVNKWLFKPFNVAVTAGQIYHIVFTNIDASPTVNFISDDHMFCRDAEPEFPATRWPMYADTKYAVHYKTPTSAWIHYDVNYPIIDVQYADGFHQGIPYMETQGSINYRTDGTNRIRQVIVMKETLTFSKVSIRSKLISGIANTGNITVYLKNSSGTILDTIVTPASFWPAATADVIYGRRWRTLTFTTPQTLVNTQTYYLEIVGTSNTGIQMMPVRDGASPVFSSGTAGTHFNNTIDKSWNTKNSHFEYSANSGSTWQGGTDQSGNTNCWNYDGEIFFTKHL